MSVRTYALFDSLLVFGFTITKPNTWRITATDTIATPIEYATILTVTTWSPFSGIITRSFLYVIVLFIIIPHRSSLTIVIVLACVF